MPRMRGQVVLELRQLDLELALGAHGVLGEDVEDQLRPVDRRASRTHSRGPAAGRARARRRRACSPHRTPRTAPSAPRACPCRRRFAVPGGLAAGPSGRRGSRLRSAPALRPRRLLVGICPLGHDRDDEPPLRLGATGNHLGHYARSLQDRPSPTDARSRGHPLADPLEEALTATSRRGPAAEAAYDDEDSARLREAERAAARAPCRSRRHRSRAGQSPGRIEDGPSRPRGDRHEGRARGDDRARALGGRDGARLDLASLFFTREELGPTDSPLPGLFERARSSTRRHSSFCLEPTDNTLQPGCLGTINARLVFEGARPTRPAPGWA